MRVDCLYAECGKSFEFVQCDVVAVAVLVWWWWWLCDSTSHIVSKGYCIECNPGTFSSYPPHFFSFLPLGSLSVFPCQLAFQAALDWFLECIMLLGCCKEKSFFSTFDLNVNAKILL